MKSPIRHAALLVLSAICLVRGQPKRTDPREEIGPATGLVVHVGCGSGEWTTHLAETGALLVQGLDSDRANVVRTRERIRQQGLIGKVSAAWFDGHHLPYADSVANLVICEAGGDALAAEANRVLRPGGVVLMRMAHGWMRTVKPWHEDLDDWTHYLHGPGNNAVGGDRTVGPPHHVQWISGPRFSRSHDHLASVSAMVSADGRLFSIVDEGPIAFAAAAPRWRLVARDAFNGLRLWNRDVTPWEHHLRDFRSGPADIARRLVASSDRVYVTLGYGAPVTALDAATGETITTYAGTDGTREILLSGDTLYLVLGSDDTEWQAGEARDLVTQRDYAPPFSTVTPPPRAGHVLAVDAESGTVRWTQAGALTASIMPATLAADGGHVAFETLDTIVCLDADTGAVRWQRARAIERRRLGWSSPTVVLHDGVLYSADRKPVATDGAPLWIPSGGYHQYIRGDAMKGELIAFDADSGERLWSCPAYEGFNSAVDIFIAGGLVWTGRYAWGNDPGITEGRDPKTGEVRRQRPADREFLPRIGHARCHRAKATENYLILGRRGVEFVNVATGDMVANLWLRGICQYGVMPANGLLYVPPHPCACSTKDMLKFGFAAFAPGTTQAMPATAAADGGPRRGPAFDLPVAAAPDGDAWPTYRADHRRSGSTGNRLDTGSLTRTWETSIGGSLTPPVVAGGLALVAEKASGTVHAVDGATGTPRWSFSVGAYVDSPPTIHRDYVLVGATNGHVYCLRLTQGDLVWDVRGAPTDRQIVVNGHLESVWPVHGSVLCLDGIAYLTAGRTSYLDGGMRLIALNVADGTLVKTTTLTVDETLRDSGRTKGGHLSDLLSSDGDSLFLRSARFGRDLTRQKDDVPHLWSSVGFLDDNWWHRTYWQVGTSMGSGWGGWPKAGQKVPAGRLLVHDDTRVFGYGRNQYDIPGAHLGIDARGVWGPVGKGRGPWTFYRLFGRTLPGTTQTADAAQEALPDWNRRVPVLGQALALAGPTLVLAGPAVPAGDVPHAPNAVDPLAAALERTTDGRLLVIDTGDGKTLLERPLRHTPVFDGMAIADGRLFIATRTGTLQAWGSGD